MIEPRRKIKFLESERMRRLWIFVLGEKPVRPMELMVMTFYWGGAMIAAGYYYFYVRPEKLKHQSKDE
jgi:hypothetical protein